MRSNSKIMAFAGVAIFAVAVFAVLATAWLSGRGPQAADAQGTDANAVKATTITVRGTGSISAKPDTLKMNVGITSIDTTVKEAQAKVDTAIAAMVAKLKAANVIESDYRTSQFSVEPVMDFNSGPNPNSQAPKLTGFRVTSILEITIHDTSKTAALLDDLVSAGANTVYNVAYSFTDPDAMAKQAYDAAVKDAEAKAARLAGLSNLALGRIVNVTDSTANVPGPVYPVMDYGKGGGGGAVFPGLQTVQSDVIVTFEAAAK